MIRFAVFGMVMGLMAGPAQAGLFDWLSGGPSCPPLDADCIKAGAYAELEAQQSEMTGQNFARLVGAMSPHQSAAEMAALRANYGDSDAGRQFDEYLPVFMATPPPEAAGIDLLRAFLEDPQGTSPHKPTRWGGTLVDALLKREPEAVADLLIEQPDRFAELMIDHTYRTIVWMARNDQVRLETYLAANDPPSRSYFQPSAHLMLIAAELCEDGGEGSALMDIARADMLRTRITLTEGGAYPVRAMLACEGMEPARQQMEAVLAVAAGDIEFQRSRGQDGAFVLQRIVRAVNEDALAPLIRALYRGGDVAGAEALAARLLPQAQVIMSLDADQEINIRKEERAPSLQRILEPDIRQNSSLDQHTALRWFVRAGEAELGFAAKSYAASAIDQIIALWPDPLAQEGYEKAMRLLGDGEFQQADKVRLALGVAHVRAGECSVSEADLAAYLKVIEGMEYPTMRLMVVPEYLKALALRDASLPECDV